MTKRILNLLTVLVMAISLAGVLPAVTVSAETYGGYEYTVLDDGTVEITKYTGSETELEIPSVINGMIVTSIGWQAFEINMNLISITIPDSVLDIGGYAFFRCKNLKYVTIGNGVTRIGYNAFDFCTSLTNVIIGNRVTSIEEMAFIDCHSLKSITIPINVKSIGYRAFSSCWSLTSITIPNSVTNIGAGAFDDCNNDLVIKCYKDNYAEQYAIGNDINYEASICEHNYTSEITTSATCTIDGVKTYTCTLCGGSYTETIPSIGHKYENGVCTVCNEQDPNYVQSSQNPSDNPSNPSDSSNPSNTNSIQPSNNEPTSATPATRAPATKAPATKAPATITPTTVAPKATTATTVTTTITKPAKVKNVKLIAKKKKLNVKWKKVSGATGYEVLYATNNKFTKNKKTVTVKKNNVTLKRLKSKKKYFVKVRAYKTVNGNTSYGKWSKVVKKKVK